MLLFDLILLSWDSPLWGSGFKEFYLCLYPSLLFVAFASLPSFLTPLLNSELQWDLATERVCGGMMTLLLKSLIV